MYLRLYMPEKYIRSSCLIFFKVFPLASSVSVERSSAVSTSDSNPVSCLWKLLNFSLYSWCSEISWRYTLTCIYFFLFIMLGALCWIFAWMLISRGFSFSESFFFKHCFMDLMSSLISLLMLIITLKFFFQLPTLFFWFSALIPLFHVGNFHQISVSWFFTLAKSETLKRQLLEREGVCVREKEREERMCCVWQDETVALSSFVSITVEQSCGQLAFSS